MIRAKNPRGQHVLSALVVATLVISTPAVSRGAEDAATSQTSSPESATDAEELPRTIDLGDFRIRDLRPTSGETASLRFKMHLKLSSLSNQDHLSQLQQWQHRLRNQVIIAVRMADTKDFAQPGLGRLRRLILLRTNRMLRSQLVEEVYLTEFTFSPE